MAGPLGPDPSGKQEYVAERAAEQQLEAEIEHAREEHEAVKDEPKKPSFWKRLFGKS